MGAPTTKSRETPVFTPQDTADKRVSKARGSLTIVGTPIGNLGDLSPRAEEALRGADTICAEDTRVASKLLSAFGIRAHVERCDENVIGARSAELVGRMEGGEHIAFVSDAGMPAVADPGARLVDACLDAGVAVDVVPGPSAVTCAIAAAGFACEAFYFGGFLPRKDRERREVLEELAGLPAVLAFYESPHRAGASLAAIAQVFPGRRVALCRELTKLHQEVVRGTALTLAEEVASREELKGEVVLLVDAPSAEERERARRLRVARGLAYADADGDGFDLDAAIRSGLAAGKAKSGLAKELAAASELTRSQIYARICELAAEGAGA